MSKLDYVTIAIVTICFAAIIFLIVKITQLMNHDQPDLEPNRIEETLGDQESPAAAEDTYDETQTEQGTPAEESATPEATGPKTRDLTGEDTYEPDEQADRDREKTAMEPMAEEESTEYSTAAEKEELTARGVGEEASRPAAGGRYMVLAGSFRYKHNAEAMVQKLRKLGYTDARVGYFNKGAFAVAVVGQYGDMNDARSTVQDLENKHQIEARIQEN